MSRSFSIGRFCCDASDRIAVPGYHPTPVQVLTIAHPTELPNALVLAQSVRERHAQWPVTILVVSDAADPAVEPPAGVTLMTLAEIDVEDRDFITAALNRDQQRNALRGAAMAALLAHGAERILYLDHRMQAFGDLGAAETALADAPVALLPYITSPDEWAGPGSLVRSGEQHGAFHPGVMAVRRSSPVDSMLADWPVRGLAIPPRVDRIGFDDQRALHDPFRAWLDSLPARVPGLAPIEGAAFVVGTWNLDSAPLTGDLNGGLDLGDQAIGLVDFQSYDPQRPHVFSPNGDGPLLSKEPSLAAICAEHSRRLAEYSTNTGADPYEHLPDQTRLTQMLRWLAGEAIAEHAIDKSIFDEHGMREFYKWLNEPQGRGSEFGLTRYHQAIYQERLDIRIAFQHLNGPGGVEYAIWLRGDGRDQFAMPDALLPPAPAPVKSSRFAARGAPEWGVNLAGFLRSEIGLGEAARLLVSALNETEVPVLPIHGALHPAVRQTREYEAAPPDAARYPINVICMNGNTIPVFARDVGTGFFEGRYSVALWWWEVDTFPAGWHEAFDYLDEIWVASDLVYHAIAPASPIPVVKVPMPVTMPEIEPIPRAQLGLPDDDFVFLFIYDYNSSSARKNPVGLVNAFKAAFTPGSGAALVLKCINAENSPQQHEEVLYAIDGHPDIHIISDFIPENEKNSLLAACDCYVSLHRSEGFGLTAAEAMWLGKPVIATRYGGTLEFMTDANSFLIDYTAVAVGPDAHPYPPDAFWADPSIEQATRAMREVFDNPQAAADRGSRASEDIRRTNSPAVAGTAMQRRLQTIFDDLPEESRYERIVEFKRQQEIVSTSERITGQLRRAKAKLKRTVARG